MDWFDLPEDAQLTSETGASRMRMYILVGLIGLGAFGVVGTLLHLLPA
ncbi:hypothetical protein MKK69_28925 [Methylobacterium sp. J-026]|nr:hypothetical protein [Methylobacterium sp. J-026]MCJ2138025.1 hypothetical protein [Methylobacterium sp. J-026]